jgi:hypothetical protein
MRISFFIAKYIELCKLEHKVKTATRPSPPNLISVDSSRAIWEVPIPGQVCRFMSAESGAINDEFFVVRVDTETFYYTWLKSSPAIFDRHGADCILRSDMPRDHKYKYATGGFANGKENPVPLAHVYADMYKEHARIGFTNGVTRSFWLIVNHAPSFPVMVHGRESAELLNHLVGLDAAPMSFSELFNTSN